MNQALKEELTAHYYANGCEASPEVKKSVQAANQLLEETVRGRNHFYILESAVSESNKQHELNGFLQGYDYCLTMMGQQATHKNKNI